jgi:hypothetical protein
LAVFFIFTMHGCFASTDCDIIWLMTDSETQPEAVGSPADGRRASSNIPTIPTAPEEPETTSGKAFPDSMGAPAMQPTTDAVDGSNGGNEPSEPPDDAAETLPNTAPTDPDQPIMTPPKETTVRRGEPSSVPPGFISAMPPEKSPLEMLRTKAGVTKRQHKRARLDKMTEALVERKRLTNEDVCKLLHISSATATRYMDELERAGKARQVGRRGHSAYEPVE